MNRKTADAVRERELYSKPRIGLFVIRKLYIKYKNFKDGLFKSTPGTLLVCPFVVPKIKLDTG